MDAYMIHIRYAASNGDTSALGAVFKRCQSSALLIKQKIHFSCRNRLHHHRNDRVLGRIILSSLHNTGIVMGLGATPYDKTVPRLPRTEIRTAFADIGRICAGCFVVCAVKAYAGERLRLLHAAKRLTDCPGVGIGQIIVVNLIGKDTNLSVKIRNGFFTDIKQVIADLRPLIIKVPVLYPGKGRQRLPGFLRRAKRRNAGHGHHLFSGLPRRQCRIGVGTKILRLQKRSLLCLGPKIQPGKAYDLRNRVFFCLQNRKQHRNSSPQTAQ